MFLVGFDWATRPIEPGIYRLRLPVPGSNDKTFSQQHALLLPGETVAPIALVAAALLCIKQVGGTDPLSGDSIRCAESAHCVRVAVSWNAGRLPVRWVDFRSDRIWLAACRRIE